MKARTVASLIGSALALASCGGRQPVEINPNTPSVAARWNGTLATPSELLGALQIRGQTWMAADEKDPGKTRAHVEISNAAPGGVHPWHVHRGQCGSDQGILGPADAYNPLKVEGDGTAKSTAEIPTPLPKTGSFFVNVHASASNMRTTVACGNLAPPSR